MGMRDEEKGLRRAAEFIRRSFHRRPRLAELAALAGLSQFHFHRRFKARFGETPRQMTARLQIEHAKRLIAQGVPLHDVAARCGFSHHSHFSTRFKRATGTQPSRWLPECPPGPRRRARAPRNEDGGQP